MSKSAILMIKDNPVFGGGVGFVKYNYQKYQAKILNENKEFEFLNTSYIHNDYLHIVSEIGIFGFLIFLICVLSIFKLFDKYSNNINKDKYIFCIAILTSIFACLIEAFINFPLHILPSAALFWIFFGILYYQLNEKLFINNKKLSFLIGIIILTLLLIIFVFNINKIISNLYLKKAILRYENKINDYINYFDISLKLDKNNYYALFYSGYFLGKEKKYEKSLYYFLKALEIYPNSADLFFNIANIKRKLNQYKEAIYYYKRTISLYPNFYLARLNLGKTYLDIDLEKEGIEEISKAKQFNNDMIYNNIILYEETEIK